MAQYPCNDGICMRCNVKPHEETECLLCSTCSTPWHVSCLTSPPETLESTREWECPDCSGDVDPVPVFGESPELNPTARSDEDEDEKEKEKENSGGDVDVLAALRDNFCCTICLELPERPVTKWVGKKKFECMKCKSAIPRKMVNDPRINASLVSAIRLARVAKSDHVGNAKVYHFVGNENRPDKAFTTERAKKTGMSNAAGGRIFVTIPPDHFGPIPAENDPTRNQGVLVGETWADRQVCKQWGAHYQYVAGISGQSQYGAQSVALSGGYKDDEDHGEWFLYTGSGGRDLSGNKRTNKDQSSDQKFTNSNEALRISCKMGYLVRVVRSHKEKRSSYAPVEKGVRYDGVYRIEKCWRKVGIQGTYMVCRYLFVRCDNEPAPSTSDEHGDRPRPLPNIPELNNSIDLFERKESPSWDFDESEGSWKWMKPPPASRKAVEALAPEERKKKAIMVAQNFTMRDKLLKEFSCPICREVMSSPVTTPCAHNFCKTCVEATYAGVTQLRERSRGGRILRAQKNVMKCPCCPTDISDFLQNPQVNREVMAVIETLKKKEEEPTPIQEVGESSGTAGEENNSEEGEEPQIVVSEDEPPTKKIKLDTE
ncbi:unnamed protein product [Microthlaspi erraticum]|uniref:RING-type E3 ubiquitin transferase n=1 Tax=Microthlaspi erraticum TaxID=1685480 RepID=A0A6D2HQY8_9BRAS|nr:unnamed protein product [Microthlaspi erraticum]